MVFARHKCSHLWPPFGVAKKIRSAYHIQKVKTELKSRNQAKYDSELNSIVSKLSCDTLRTIVRGKETGQWISVQPSTVNGTELSAQEYRDAFLQSYCDGCGQKFIVRHAHACKKGGLVISRHNEI
jgi:hypothetical protein